MLRGSLGGLGAIAAIAGSVLGEHDSNSTRTEHHRAEQRLLGVEVVRRDAAGA
jgi:hypothetical protein